MLIVLIILASVFFGLFSADLLWNQRVARFWHEWEAYKEQQRFLEQRLKDVCQTDVS